MRTPQHAGFLLITFALTPPFLLSAGAAGKGRSSPGVVRLTRDGSFKQQLCWSPDGKSFLFTRLHGGRMGLWVVNADGTGLQPFLTPDPGTPHFDANSSADGKEVAFVLDVLQGTDGKLRIDAARADGTGSRTVIPHQAFEESPRWSPDGRRLAWVSTRSGAEEVYSADAAGRDVKRLTRGGMNNNPSWSPDGKRLAFASARSGNFEVHVMDADGGNVRRLTDHPSLDYWPSWSPDGRRLAFTSNRDGNYEIYVLDADGRNPRNLTRHPAQDNFAAWSPDGKRLAFISNRDGGHDLYVAEAW